MSDRDKKSRGGGSAGNGDRGPDDKGGPRERRPPPERSGHIAPPDPALVEWLERLWTRDTPPMRLEVWWVIGINRDVRRSLVFYENFRQPETPADNWHVEHCARLSGELLQAAQDWTDSKRKACSFEIAIVDSYQQTRPLTRAIGPLQPGQAYAGVYPDGEPRDDEDDDDATIGIKPLSHKYVSKMFRSLHRMMEQTHAMAGDFMQLQQHAIQQRDASNERLHMINAQLHEQKQTAEDRATERAMWVKREEMKNKAIGSGLKVTENLLYGWFGMTPEVSGGAGAGAGEGGDGKALQAPRRHAPSAEQRLIESFLEEAAEEQLSVKLFGDWRDTDKLTLQDVFAGVRLEQPGIFTAQQFGILLGVAQGALAPDALDALMPDSGKPAAVTFQQLTEAQPLLTQGMKVAFERIQALRMEARERRAAQAQTIDSGAAPQEGQATP